MSFEYAPAPQSRAVVDIAPRYGLFINGEFAEAADGKAVTTLNPATEEVLSEVAQGGAGDVDRAVRSARTAFGEWSALPGAERAKYLFRIARIIQERSRELAVLETLDTGKPIRISRDLDLPQVAAHFFYYAGWADKVRYAYPYPAYLGGAGGVWAEPKPLGVAGQVLPFDFPLMMLAWKVAPALAAGNTVVVKPAETTPLSALFFADICGQAGLPPGVVNIVTGDDSTGAELVAHPGVAVVAFSGSTQTGKAVARSVAGKRKRLLLGLGGTGANIVFADAPMDQAVEGVINGSFAGQGPICCATSRLLVEEAVAEEFVDALRRRMTTLRVGDPLDKNTDVGAINSAGQLARIRALAETGEAEGAERWSPAGELPADGYWFAPTLFTSVAPAHRIARAEICGPVLSVLTFRTPDEAVTKANNTPYGTSAGVWTEKGSRALWLAERLRAGVVWANTDRQFDPAAPFGGYRESGFGREGGRHGLHAYLAPAAAAAPSTESGPARGGEL